MLIRCLRDKRGIAIPIGILTVMLIVLLVYTGFYVLSREKDIRGEVDVRMMDEMYVSEMEMDLILRSIFDKVVYGLDIEGAEEVFVEEVLEELESYKKDGGYLVRGLDDVESQVSEVVVESGKLIWDVELELIEESEGVEIWYDYKRVFEKVL